MWAKNLFHKAVLTYLYDKPLNEETSIDIYTVKMPDCWKNSDKPRSKTSKIEICKKRLKTFVIQLQKMLLSKVTA